MADKRKMDQEINEVSDQELVAVMEEMENAKTPERVIPKETLKGKIDLGDNT